LKPYGCPTIWVLVRSIKNGASIGLKLEERQNLFVNKLWLT